MPIQYSTKTSSGSTSRHLRLPVSVVESVLRRSTEVEAPFAAGAAAGGVSTSGVLNVLASGNMPGAAAAASVLMTCA